MESLKCYHLWTFTCLSTVCASICFQCVKLCQLSVMLGVKQKSNVSDSVKENPFESTFDSSKNPRRQQRQRKHKPLLHLIPINYSEKPEEVPPNKRNLRKCKPAVDHLWIIWALTLKSSQRLQCQKSLAFGLAPVKEHFFLSILFILS